MKCKCTFPIWTISYLGFCGVSSWPMRYKNAVVFFLREFFTKEERALSWEILCSSFPWIFMWIYFPLLDGKEAKRGQREKFCALCFTQRQAEAEEPLSRFLTDEVEVKKSTRTCSPKMKHDKALSLKSIKSTVKQDFLLSEEQAHTDILASSIWH